MSGVQVPAGPPNKEHPLIATEDVFYLVQCEHMKRYYLSAGIIALVLSIGLLVPLGTYTTNYGCRVDPTPTVRLHLIKGDSLNEVKDRKDPVGAGCTVNTQYILYLF